MAGGIGQRWACRRSADKGAIGRDAGARPISRLPVSRDSPPQRRWSRSLTGPRIKTRVGADDCRVDLGPRCESRDGDSTHRP
jgi:hypothetical protein